jgi:hypothetical protein
MQGNYQENPEEEALLQQGINPELEYAFGGLVRKLYDGGSEDELV